MRVFYEIQGFYIDISIRWMLCGYPDSLIEVSPFPIELVATFCLCDDPYPDPFMVSLNDAIST